MVRAGHQVKAGAAVQPGGHPVGKNLISNHGHLTFFAAQTAARHPQADGERLAGQRYPGKAHALGKGAHPLGRVVGDDGQADACCAHLVQPSLHGGLQHLTVVPGQGVVHIQHQRPDAVRREEVRVDTLDFFKDIFGG